MKIPGLVSLLLPAFYGKAVKGGCDCDPTMSPDDFSQEELGKREDLASLPDQVTIEDLDISYVELELDEDSAEPDTLDLRKRHDVQARDSSGEIGDSKFDVFVPADISGEVDGGYFDVAEDQGIADQGDQEDQVIGGDQGNREDQFQDWNWPDTPLPDLIFNYDIPAQEGDYSHVDIQVQDFQWPDIALPDIIFPEDVRPNPDLSIDIAADIRGMPDCWWCRDVVSSDYMEDGEDVLDALASDLPRIDLPLIDLLPADNALPQEDQLVRQDMMPMDLSYTEINPQIDVEGQGDVGQGDVQLDAPVCVRQEFAISSLLTFKIDPNRTIIIGGAGQLQKQSAWTEYNFADGQSPEQLGMQTFAPSGFTTNTVAGDYLNISSRGLQSVAMFFMDNMSWANDSLWMADKKMALNDPGTLNNEALACAMNGVDGSKDITMSITPIGVSEINSGQIWPTGSESFNPFAFNDYLVAGQWSDYAVFLNNQYIMDGTNLLTTGNPSKILAFGDLDPGVDPDVYCDARYDYLRAYNGTIPSLFVENGHISGPFPAYDTAIEGAHIIEIVWEGSAPADTQIIGKLCASNNLLELEDLTTAPCSPLVPSGSIDIAGRHIAADIELDSSLAGDQTTELTGMRFIVETCY